MSSVQGHRGSHLLCLQWLWQVSGGLASHMLAWSFKMPLGMHMRRASSMHCNSTGSSGAAATTAQAQAAPAGLCRACERPNSMPSVYWQRALLVQQVWREWVHWLMWLSPGFSPVPYNYTSPRAEHCRLQMCFVVAVGIFQQNPASCSSVSPDGPSRLLLGFPSPQECVLIGTGHRHIR